jgi:hypothetical protein
MPSSETFFERGEDHLNAVLTEERVKHIRRSSEGLDALAVRFGVNRTTIHRARIGQSWGHVPGATRRAPPDS